MIDLFSFNETILTITIHRQTLRLLPQRTVGGVNVSPTAIHRDGSRHCSLFSQHFNRETFPTKWLDPAASQDSMEPIQAGDKHNLPRLSYRGTALEQVRH